MLRTFCRLSTSTCRRPTQLPLVSENCDRPSWQACMRLRRAPPVTSKALPLSARVLQGTSVARSNSAHLPTRDTNNTNGSLLVVCHAILLAHPPGEESLPDPSIVTCSGASFVLIWRYISMHVSVTPSAACRGEQPSPVACDSAPQCSAARRWYYVVCLQGHRAAGSIGTTLQ